jgi:hypothetical protein
MAFAENGPLRLFPSPYHTKLWQQRTPLEQYEAQESIGTRMRRWDRPVHDFASVYMRGALRRTIGITAVADDVEHRRELDTMADMMRYLRAKQGGPPGSAESTAIGSNLFSAPEYLRSTLESREARYFPYFLEESDPGQRSEILDVVSPEMGRALTAQWISREARIAQAEGKAVPPLGEDGRLFDEESLSLYRQAGTKLSYGDWLRSKEIADFFASSGYSLPEPGSPSWSYAVDYEDVKLKIVQQEGYDYHDFNFYDDRAALLWRKPYLDGVIRELTSGENRSAEQIRSAVEQIIMSGHDRNPTVYAVSHPSRNATGNLYIDAEVDDDNRKLLRRSRDFE